MDAHTLKLLEYDRLLALWADCAQTGPGREFCLARKPDLDEEQARFNWELIDQARRIIQVEGPPPVDDFHDPIDLLERLEKSEEPLAPLELRGLLVLLQNSRRLKTYLLTDPDRAPLLAEEARELPVHRDLEKSLELSIGPDGEILDSAGPELARVRKEHAGLRSSIQSRLNGLMKSDQTRSALQDEIITQRSGRYVVPVRVSMTRQLPGLVHDYSSSGATAFVEPLEMVEDNNRLNYLTRQEAREIEKILRRLTSRVAQVAEDISRAAGLLVLFDALFAAAELSRKHQARTPETMSEGGVDLLKARHPLLTAKAALSGRKVVPLDIRLNSRERILVVSGVNAGGKTAALKTLGLLTLMAQTGLHLPVAEGSRFCFFDRVLAAIGDEQDLQSDLSTFSGHVRRVSWVLDQVTDRSLVLLDELGTGTDPAEGAALALAVLDELSARGAWVMTATHYQMLKTWAQMNEGALNAAVMTDSSGRPVYGLKYGSPGFSAGLTMAAEMGLNPAVVERAEKYLDDGQKNSLSLMRRLEEERALLEESRREVEFLEQELAAAALRIRAGERKRAEAHVEEIKKLRAKAERMMIRAEKDFDTLLRRMKKQNGRAGQAEKESRKIKTELRQALTPPAPELEPVGAVQPGLWVHVSELGRNGLVKTVNQAKGKVEVEIDGMMIQTGLDRLAQATGKPKRSREEPRATVRTVSTADLSNELNLLGFTVDEALPYIEKSLDMAFLGGVKRLAIVHGKGTGRLRRAVRGYLKGDSRVKHFQPGDARLGGEGVTMVDLTD